MAAGEFVGPIYIQLAHRCRELIRSSRWPEGKPVPGEVDLAREFGVSIGTMRQALKLLEKSGWLARSRGRGTVALNPLKASETTLLAFRGPSSGDDGLRDVVVADLGEVGDLFDRHFGTSKPQVGHLRRGARLWRHACGLTALERVEMMVSDPAYHPPGLLPADAVAYTVLQADDELVQAVAVVTVLTADTQLARIMQVSVGAPLLGLSNMACDRNEEVLCRSEMIVSLGGCVLSLPAMNAVAYRGSQGR